MNLFGKRNLVENAELKDLKSQIEGLVKDKRTLTETVEELKLRKRLNKRKSLTCRKSMRKS